MNSLLICQSAAISAPLAVKDAEGFFVWAKSRGFTVCKAEAQAAGRYVLHGPPGESWLNDEERYPDPDVFWNEIATEFQPFLNPGDCAILYEATINTCTRDIPVWVGAMVHILRDGMRLHGDLIDLATSLLSSVEGTHDVYDAGTGGTLVHTLSSSL